MATSISPAEAVRDVITRVIAPAAGTIDASGSFPEAGIRELGECGALGMLSTGSGLRQAAEVIEALAGACGSSAMIVLMHYSAVPVIEANGPPSIREAIASGKHLTTLAFSEAGSRSHFWAPLGTARSTNGHVRLDAEKSWVTAARHADSYVWSSRPLGGEGPMTLWLVPTNVAGFARSRAFDGLGLRGNESAPVSASGVLVEPEAMLGADGAGLDLALTHVLPSFLVLSAAFSLGLMEATTSETAAHLNATRLAHLDRSLAQQQTVRLDFARMRLETDRTRALLLDTLAALESQRADAMLRVLEVKAAAAESALQVTDLAMKVCGGAAFRKELGIERRFRDARAARVMAPTTDALLDFVGRASLGLPLLEDVVAR